MDWKLEMVVVPVTDMDRAKAFYVDQAGFDLVVDHTAGDFRVIQLTPPGSDCSIALLKDSPMTPGSLHGMHLCVNDIEAARVQLVGRGVDASEPFYIDGTGQHAGIDPERHSYATFISFHDVDGNTWMVQEVRPDGATA
jgi:predicted enzyme related to lactoylglutathione lyase